MSRRPLAVLLSTAVFAAAFVFPPAAGPAAASARGDWWRARAITAINKFATLDDGAEQAGAYADAAYAEALLYGWSHAAAQAYLTKLRAARTSTGGYGIGRPWDAFQDGTVNPADTTYTVTLSGVGSVLLAAYKAGAVPRAEVQQVVSALMAIPRVPVPRGDCVAYSQTAADAAAGCVHNVNAGVAAFLSAANAQGFGATGLQKLITGITIAELVAYREAEFWWPYVDSGPSAAQDPDHNSYSAESMYGLAYWVGREVAYRQMTTAPGVNAQDPIAHGRLTGLPGGPGSWSGTSTTVTLWCVLGDTWRTEQDAYLAGITDAGRAAQVASYAARNSRACP
jgi:hypothetical protein